MKITKVDILQVKTVNPGWRPIFCRIHTDKGIYGDGEAALAYGNAAYAAFGMIRDFASLIIGMDPMKPEVIWEKIYKDTFWGQNGGPVTFSGISAIDIALWDIKGKALKVPVHLLLGGKCRDEVRAYASQLQNGWFPDDVNKAGPRCCVNIDDYRAAATYAMEDGYDAVKIDLFAWTPEGKRYERDVREKIIAPKDMEDIVERMAVTREAVGPHTEIIVENHSRIDAPGAIQVANAVEKFGVMYFEEPNTPNPYTARMIAENVNVPLASGERIYSRWQYAPYFENRSLQVIQPDIGNCGGLTEAKKICDMAHTYDVCVQPHICASPLSTTVALHLEAVIPNFVIHEHHTNNRTLAQKNMTTVDPQPKNGKLQIPDEPGLGNEITQFAYDNAELHCVVE